MRYRYDSRSHRVIAPFDDLAFSKNRMIEIDRRE